MKIKLNNKNTLFKNNDNNLKIQNKTIINKLPIVRFTGDITGMTKENEKMLDIEFENEYGEIVFRKKALTTWQGDSSLNYPKKNWAIDLLEEDEDTEYKCQFRDWPEQDSYHLKANYIDSTHARNIVNANIAKDMYKNPLPSGARGVIDGFPIIMYVNGEKKGIYTWNLKQHRDVYGLSKKDSNHMMYRGTGGHTGPLSFKQLSVDNTDTAYFDWEDRHPKKMTEENRNKLNRLIQWVMMCDDNKFITEIDQYMDKEYLIDYWLFSYVAGIIDNLGKNLNIVTFDGNIWYPTFYDLDSTWGLDVYLNKTKSPEIKCPDNYCQGNNSYLWERVRHAFKYEIKERYSELRETIFDAESLKQRFRDFINKIPQEEYDDDFKINPTIFKDAELDFIENWIDERLAYVDSILLADITEIKATDVRINFDGGNSPLSGTYNLVVGEQTFIHKTFFPVNSNNRIITTSSEDNSILINDCGLITAVSQGNTNAVFKIGTRTQKINFNILPKFETTEDLTTDGLIMWVDARDFENSIPENDRTGYCPLEILGEPIYENGALLFDGIDDGIFIRNLFQRIPKYKEFTIEIWYNDIYSNVSTGTIASLGTEYRGYGNVGVSYGSGTKILVGRTQVYADGKITFDRGLNTTNRAIITQGSNKIVTMHNDDIGTQNNIQVVGKDACIGCTSNDKFYKSSFCSMRIYGRVLTEEEILRNKEYELKITRL